MKATTEICREFKITLEMSEAEARSLKLVLWKASREAPNSFDLSVMRKVMTALPITIAPPETPEEIERKADEAFRKMKILDL